MLSARLRTLLATAAFTVAGACIARAAEDEEFDLRRFLAPFHSVVLHYPIGFVTLAAIIELFTLRRKSSDLRFVTRLVMGLGAVTSIMAAALGWFRAAAGGYETGALESHRISGVVVTALAVVGFSLLLAAGRDGGRRIVIWIYRGTLAGCLTFLVVAGHQGGNLTHGSNYLFEGAPTFLKAMLAVEDGMSSADPLGLDEKQRFFTEQVRPIFDQKCASCHGEEKQKGAYRLDKREIAFKGGDSEMVAIKESDPLASNLVRLILLPPEHDDVMPPSGKSMVTPEEIGKIVHWIRTGAVFVERGAVAARTVEKPEPPTPPEPEPR